MKTLALAISLCLAASTAFGFTQAELKRLEQVRTLVRQGKVEYNQATAAAAAADQRAADAEQRAASSDQHAASTDVEIGKVKKQIDEAHNREVALKAENDKMAPVYKRVTGPWWAPGLGAIIYGVERLAKFTLIFTAVVAVALLLLVIIAPAVIPALEAAGIAVLRVLRMIGGLILTALRGAASAFRKKPAPAPPVVPIGS